MSLNKLPFSAVETPIVVGFARLQEHSLRTTKIQFFVAWRPKEALLREQGVFHIILKTQVLTIAFSFQRTLLPEWLRRARLSKSTLLLK
jgi:hypothetical protein